MRTATILIAFDAGSRAEHREENGIAHFLEHAVFKGGERFPRADDISRAADRLGAQLNAYTAPDHVAFHISVRSERALEAADLLTDFVGRPRFDAADLETERGVVIQEIARAHDQPAALADQLIDAAAFGDHPLGRPVLGTPETLGSLGREDLLAFRARRWANEKGVAIVAGDLSHLADDGLDELLDRLPRSPPPPPFEASPRADPQVLVEPRESEQTHLRLGYRPPLDDLGASARHALQIYVTLLGGTSGSRLFEEIRERLGLAYSVRATDYAMADDVLVQIEAGLESSRCREAYLRIREIVDRLAAEGITEEEIDRARSAAAGRKVLAFQRIATVAQHAAREHVVFGANVDPDQEIAGLDSVRADDVVQVARSMALEPAVACVGPHSAEDFD